jgi:hypothetical protein
MALVTYKNPIDRFRGSVRDRSGSGLTIYDSAKAGNVARRYIKPTNPNSVLQQWVRGNFTTAAQGFAALSATIAAGWNAAAEAYKRDNPLDVEYGFSGINLYMEVNAYRLLNGIELTDTPPTDITYPVLDPSNCTFTATVGSSPLLVTKLGSMVINPATTPQFFFTIFTPPWTRTARIPRRSDYAIRGPYETYYPTFPIPPSTLAGIPQPMYNAAKPVMSGDKVWVSTIGLSADYVPAPSASAFQVTLTTTP